MLSCLMPSKSTLQQPRANPMIDASVKGTALPRPIQNYCDFLAQNQLEECSESLALYQVHEDLRLVRGWSDVRVVKAVWIYLVGVAPREFDSVFPASSDPSVDRTQAVVPVVTRATFTPRLLHNMCADVVHPATLKSFRCVTVAIVDQDSTTAYYRVFNKFDEIVHAQWKQKKVQDANGEAGKGEVDEMAADSGDDDDSSSGSCSASSASDSES